jgi:hypothetical protein
VISVRLRSAPGDPRDPGRGRGPWRWTAGTRLCPRAAPASVGAIDPARTPHADGHEAKGPSERWRGCQVRGPARGGERSRPSTGRQVSGEGAAGPGRPYRQCAPPVGACRFPPRPASATQAVPCRRMAQRSRCVVPPHTHDALAGHGAVESAASRSDTCRPSSTADLPHRQPVHPERLTRGPPRGPSLRRPCPGQ